MSSARAPIAEGAAGRPATRASYTIVGTGGGGVAGCCVICKQKYLLHILRNIVSKLAATIKINSKPKNILKRIFRLIIE